MSKLLSRVEQVEKRSTESEGSYSPYYEDDPDLAEKVERDKSQGKSVIIVSFVDANL